MFFFNFTDCNQVELERCRMDTFLTDYCASATPTVEIPATNCTPITPTLCITSTSTITATLTNTVTSACPQSATAIYVSQQITQCSLATTTTTISPSCSQTQQASSHQNTTNQSSSQSEVNITQLHVAVLGALLGLSVVLLAVVTTG